MLSPESGPVLAVNAGSTGVKLHLVDRDECATAVGGFDEVSVAPAAVGHRVVFGGALFTAPALIDDRVRGELGAHGALAPLHNGPAVRLIDEARACFPGVPHVAVFDTAFHATLPDEASVYPVPTAWRTEWDVRRHGFHGLSVQWAAGRAPELLGRPPGDDLRLVVCHLGGGASATAVRAGRSVDTSMGFSPLEGLMMATRAGSLDPTIPLHLILHAGLAPQEVHRMLNENSGLVALAGTTDMREVEARAARGDEPARVALEVHDHRLAATVAAMAASLGGLDAVAFTGGVGQGSARVRAEAARRLGFLGMSVDARLNSNPDGDADVSSAIAAVRTLVIQAREEIVIARAARRVLAAMPAAGAPA
jgi:acetate kinase